MSSQTNVKCSKLWFDCHDYRCDAHYMKLCPKGPEVFNSIFGAAIEVSERNSSQKQPIQKVEPEVFCSANHDYCIKLESIIKDKMNMEHCADCEIDAKEVPIGSLPGVKDQAKH